MSSAYEYREIQTFEVIADVNVPLDQDGRHLDHNDVITRNGVAMARQLTSPYGSLEFAVGYEPDDNDNDNESELDDSYGIPSDDDENSGGSDDDWFRCFDYAELPDGRIILHAIVNSESGGYIDGAGYFVVTKEEAPQKAMDMVCDALEIVGEYNRTHDEDGWNQDPYYFVRAVAAACGVEPFASATEKSNRRGPVPPYLTLATS